MKKVLSKILIIALSGFLGFFSGQCIKFTYEATTFQPYHWPTPPIIVNCYGKDFSELQMIRAIDYWALRGQNIGFYEHDPPKEVCDEKWLDGWIIIRKAGSMSDDSTLAVTIRKTSLNKMRGAVIRYRPGSFNIDLINEHELGHAFGFMHVEKEGHIMHPHLEKMGRDFYKP